LNKDAQTRHKYAFSHVEHHAVNKRFFRADWRGEKQVYVAHVKDDATGAQPVSRGGTYKQRDIDEDKALEITYTNEAVIAVGVSFGEGDKYDEADG
jgi:hypothetical protein